MLYKGRTLVVPVNIFDSSWTAGLHVAALEGYLCMVLLKEIIRHKDRWKGGRTFSWSGDTIFKWTMLRLFIVTLLIKYGNECSFTV